MILIIIRNSIIYYSYYDNNFDDKNELLKNGGDQKINEKDEILKENKKININLVSNKNNKNTIKINLSNKDSKTSCLDNRGFMVTENGSFIDNNGDYFNSDDGTDENGGKYDKYGEYLNGPNFNSEIGMYKDDIKNSSFDDENELKQEIKESQEVEFEKIKNEGYESKNLINNYIRPFEDNSDSLNISISEDDNIDEEDENDENDENSFYKSSIKRIKKNNKVKPIIIEKDKKISEKIINKERISEMKDIDNYIIINNIMAQYKIDFQDNDEVIDIINDLYRQYKKKIIK